jgi:molybdopterin/thiamine biosynthesis adenylyltransferase
MGADVLFKGQMNMPGHGVQGQQKIESMRLLVIGAGGIGNPLAQLLVRSGFRDITIVDFDIVEQSNLPRQFIFRESDIGQLKAMALAKHLNKSLSENVVVGVADDVRNLNVAEFDFVLEGTDSVKAKFEISRRCQASNTPFIMGSIFKNTSQIYIFPNATSTVNMSDVFCHADTELVEQSCSTVGIYAHQCMLTASIMVSECIKTVLFGRKEAMLINCNLQSNTMTSVPVTGVRGNDDPAANSAISDLQSEVFEPELVDLGIVDSRLVYDVRDESEYEGNPGQFTNFPSRFVIRAANLDDFKSAVFVCASGKRAKLIAKHVNAKTGCNTARYGIQF